MFKSLLSSVVGVKSGLLQEIKELKELHTSNSTKIVEMEQKQKEKEKEVELVKKDLVSCEDEMERMVNMIARQNQIIAELHNKVDDLEKNKYKSNLFIKGIDFGDDEQCVQVMKDFLE